MSTLAERQLAAWQEIAAHWPLRITTDVCECVQCGKGVYLIRDTRGLPFRWTYDQRLAQTVLHLRNHHADLDPDK